MGGREASIAVNFHMLPDSVLCFSVTQTSMLLIVSYSPTKNHSDNVIFQFLKIRKKGNIKYLAENTLQPLLSTFAALMTIARNLLRKSTSVNKKICIFYSENQYQCDKPLNSFFS